jgi:hypothetical protein
LKVSTRLIAAGLTLLLGMLVALPFRRPSAPTDAGEAAEILRLPTATAREMLTAPLLGGANGDPEGSAIEDAVASDSLPMADENADEENLAGEIDRETKADKSTRRSSSVSVSPASERDQVGLAALAEDALPLVGPIASQGEAPQLSRRFPTALAATAEERPLAPVERAMAPERVAPASGIVATANSENQLATPASPSAAPQPQLVIKRHRIRDGDTLEKLAQRYLGSSDRFAEIFDRNRDVLADPYLLPIGKELSVLVPADTIRQD